VRCDPVELLVHSLSSLERQLVGASQSLQTSTRRTHSLAAAWMEMPTIKS
jgi:hypothetical protein